MTDRYDFQAEYLIVREYVPNTVNVIDLAQKLRSLDSTKTHIKNNREDVYGKDLAEEIEKRMKNIADDEMRLIGPYESNDFGNKKV